MRYALYDQNDELLRYGEFDSQPPDPVGKGWYWAEDPAPPPVPQQVNNAQMRAVLLGAGLLDGINGFIAGSGDPAAAVAWEYGNVIHRISPLVQAAQAALELTDEQVDQLFIAASTIEF